MYSKPRISIVTPSFNQAPYVEECIRSILDQNYSNLQYIFIDGGSSDDTMERVKPFESKIDFVVSEKDRGQAHAINKGFKLADGDIIGWINADDMLLPGALEAIGKAVIRNKNKIILAPVKTTSDFSSGSTLLTQRNVDFLGMVRNWEGWRMSWNQPGTWLPHEVLSKCGFLNEKLRYTFDREWLCRILAEYDVFYIDFPVASFRYHKESKSSGERDLWIDEQLLVTKKFLDSYVESQLEAEHYLVWGALSYLNPVLATVDRKVAFGYIIKALNRNKKILLSRRFYFILFLLFLPQSIMRKIKCLLDK